MGAVHVWLPQHALGARSIMEGVNREVATRSKRSSYPRSDRQTLLHVLSITAGIAADWAGELMHTNMSKNQRCAR
jgi:hypothetical protein